jgi:hypothetical protein
LLHHLLVVVFDVVIVVLRGTGKLIVYLALLLGRWRLLHLDVVHHKDIMILIVVILLVECLYRRLRTIPLVLGRPPHIGLSLHLLALGEIELGLLALLSASTSRTSLALYLKMTILSLVRLLNGDIHWVLPL